MGTGIEPNHVRLKRAYEHPGSDDGKRILVDRLWPRGVSKGEAAIDEWMKELSPSTELRKWYGHEPERWEEFQKRYAEELSQSHAQLEHLRDLARDSPVTLVYSAHDEARNNAVVLRNLLLKS
ncbi:MAG: DUF488 domain-containing protein [Phyllobacterium sp.]